MNAGSPMAELMDISIYEITEDHLEAVIQTRMNTCSSNLL